MSKIKLEGNASGSGTLTISAPSTNTDRSLTLPDTAGEIVTTAGATFTGDVNFGDNDKAQFGADSDLQIYHDGSKSVISDTGTGNLVMYVGDLQIVDATGTNNLIRAYDSTGEVKVFYGGAEKLATTSFGIEVKDSLPIIRLTDTDTNYYGEIKGANGTLYISADAGNGAGNTHIRFDVDNDEKMRIDSNGNLLVGTSSTYSNNFRMSVLMHSSSDRGGIIYRAAASSGTPAYFQNASGSEVGKITTSNTITSYNTSSDYRLKENVVDMTGAIDRVKALQPKRFNFIAAADTTVDGFLAHEVSDVIPEAISGEKDATREEEYEVTPAVLDDDGNVVTEAVMGTRTVPVYQGIDQSKLVPLLTGALQEAIAKIETLETTVADLTARIEALENA